jgi:mannose-1-phosphate guanylyltransferase/phosphomannomutase
MSDKYIAVIQAGGKGTRLQELTHNRIPKPMLEMNGKPMLEWQIEALVQYEIKDIIIIVGYLGEKIQEYFRDGSRWGVNISYIQEERPLGSAGALYYLKNKICKDILYIFGDIMFDIDWQRFIDFHNEKKALATLLVHPNSHPYDSDLVELDEDDKVVAFKPKSSERKEYFDNCVNGGIYIFKHGILDILDNESYSDLEKDILSMMVPKDQVYGYKSSEYVKDAGTPKRFNLVSEQQKKGIWQVKNLKNKQKCFFLDRDGTINIYKGLISNIDEFELEDNAAQAVREINNSGYLAIVVTNQPVVARGMCEYKTVNHIHRKMSTLLGEQGAYLDEIIFCPHHPDQGYLGENKAFKIKCTCRKPLTGMIDKMVRKYNIDKSQSFIIGDTTTDVQMGKNAGIKTVLVQTGQAGKDGKYDVCPDMEAKNLFDAVRKILSLGGEK